MSLDIPKGLGASPYQRIMFWAPKIEDQKPRKQVCVCIFKVCARTLDSSVPILPKP